MLLFSQCLKGKYAVAIGYQALLWKVAHFSLKGMGLHYNWYYLLQLNTVTLSWFLSSLERGQAK